MSAALAPAPSGGDSVPSASPAPLSPAPLSQVRFFIDADADPGLLARLLIPFARRDLTPDRMWSHRAGAVMHVEIAFAAAPEQEIAQAEGNLRQIVGIHRIHRVMPG